MNKWWALCLWSAAAMAQPKPEKVSWQTLENIKYDEKYIAEIKGYMLFPKFTPKLLGLHGKIVDITGYVIPVDKTGKTLALSANPYASCYFCGGGSPASVMTVKLRTRNTGYDIDDYKTFRGRLRLNATDIHEFYFVLETADDVSP